MTVFIARERKGEFEELLFKIGVKGTGNKTS